MVNVVYCVRKLAGLTDEVFRDYWLNIYGPLVTRFANIIRAEKYIQSHTVPTPVNALVQKSRGLAEPYDGITEIWFKDLESVQQVLASSSAQEALMELTQDESKFLDFSSSRMFMSEDRIIF